MSSVRLRRLFADYEKVTRYVREHPRIELVQAEGNPPERYQLHYQVLGLRRKDEELVEVNSHLVEITLPRDYPRTPPQCRMLTPVFHPNIAPHAICIGDHWSAGEPLPSLIARIGEMITYQSYNTKSPLNGDAARWTDKNQESLPLESVSMVLDDDSGAPTAPAVAAHAAAQHPRPAAAAVTASPAPGAAEQSPAPAPAPESFPCPSCASRLRHAPALIGKKIRCPKCQTICSVPPIAY